MNAIECPREPEVLDAVALGRCPGELRDHAAACSVCGDLWAVATALAEERDAAWRQARVPTAGQVWWRATMRARSEAALAAARPIALLQLVAAAAGLAACAALIAELWPAALPALGWAASALTPAGAGALAWAAPAWWLGVAALAGLVLAPVLLYLALADE